MLFRPWPLFTYDKFAHYEPSVDPSVTTTAGHIPAPGSRSTRRFKVDGYIKGSPPTAPTYWEQIHGFI